MNKKLLLFISILITTPLLGSAQAEQQIYFHQSEIYGQQGNISDSIQPLIETAIYPRRISAIAQVMDVGTNPPVIKAGHRRQDLAGKRGRTRGSIPRRGGCAKIFKQYVAAAGHSAYVQSVVVSQARFDQSYVCMAVRNRPTKAAAESAAIAACQKGAGKYKNVRKKCVVKASK